MSENVETGGGAGGAVSQDAKKWATICHISALLGLFGGVGFIVGPLVVWLIKRNDDPFIDEQGTEAVNFQITMVIAFLICIPLLFILIGLPLMLLVGAVDIIFAIIAAMKANDGVHYRYPLSIRMIKPRGA